MRILFATLLLFTAGLACTPKVGSKIGAGPIAPDTPERYDSIGKPLIGEEAQPIAEYDLLDGVDVRPEDAAAEDTLPAYNPSHTFEHDLIHTKINIRFDWEKKHALGKATLTLRPWFYSTDRLTLDAKNFDIHSIRFEGQNTTLPYDYDKEKLVIQLGKTFTRNDE